LSNSPGQEGQSITACAQHELLTNLLRLTVSWHTRLRQHCVQRQRTPL